MDVSGKPAWFCVSYGMNMTVQFSRHGDYTEKISNYLSNLLIAIAIAITITVVTILLQNYSQRKLIKLQLQWKKRSEETQTLRAGCSKAEPKIFAPPQTPFPGVRDGQNLNSWRWLLPLSINPVWWGSMHAISSYRGNSLSGRNCLPRAGFLRPYV